MDQTCQPEFAAVLEGSPAEISEAEILAAVRRVLTAEEAIDPEIAAASGDAAKGSLAARLLGRFLN